MMASAKSLGPWLAGLLPLVGLCVLVAKAEIALSQGPVFRVPIRGYDPLDRLHGRYVQYLFDFEWQGEDECKWANPAPTGTTRGEERTLYSSCCLCLTRTSADGFDPFVRHVDCGAPALGCDGWLDVNEMESPSRYFVPEEKADALQNALNNSETTRPSVEFVLPGNGKPSVKELYLGDDPWRESLGE